MHTLVPVHTMRQDIKGNGMAWLRLTDHLLLRAHAVRTFRAAFLWLLIGVPGALVTAPAQATARIVCSSINYQPARCNAWTQGRVQLVRELSTGNLCRQGRTWGFDDRSIWVSNGCRAEFEFGQRGPRPGIGPGPALAPGIIALLSSPRGGPPPFGPPPGRPGVPGWAVGSFSAWDSWANDTVLLSIDSRGRASLRNGRGRTVAEGLVRQGVVRWNSGHELELRHDRVGLTLVTLDRSRQQYTFRRG